jgi:hypothetical protein
MTEKPTRYYSYLLRLWQISSDESIWRASLQTPGSGERRGFASLRELFDFLEAQTVTKKNKNEQKKGESDES